jgi:hypothetical protein
VTPVPAPTTSTASARQRFCHIWTYGGMPAWVSTDARYRRSIDKPMIDQLNSAAPETFAAISSHGCPLGSTT